MKLFVADKKDNNKFIVLENFTQQEIPIAIKIQQRRLQLLVHSRIYYELNRNLISDFDFDLWAKELVELQEKYPEIAKRICYHKAFEDWDGSTGAFLPLDDEWVIKKANQLLKTGGKETTEDEQANDKHKEIQQETRNTSCEKPKSKTNTKQRSNSLF